jgi:hypothetical protein
MCGRQVGEGRRFDSVMDGNQTTRRVRHAYSGHAQYALPAPDLGNSGVARRGGTQPDYSYVPTSQEGQQHKTT